MTATCHILEPVASVTNREGSRVAEKEVDMNEVAAGKYTGGCHCGAVRFEVELDLQGGGGRCNCSICTKTAVTSALVKPDALRLLTSEAALGTYEWGAKISRRFFCRECGIHCFGRGHLAEVGGDYVAVNLNCLEGVELTELPVQYWDGRHNNWEGGPRSEPWPIGISEPARRGVVDRQARATCASSSSGPTRRG